MLTRRSISTVCAALIIVSLLVATNVDGPWFGIGGWGIALVVAIAWAVSIVRRDKAAAPNREQL